MRILFLSRWFPHPPSNGSRIRILNLLRSLGSQHAVDLISFYQPVEGEPDTSGLVEICRRIETIPYRGFQPGSRKSLLGFFSPTPRAYLDTHSVAMDTAIRKALSRERFDLVIASQVDMAVYAGAFGNVPAVFEEVEAGVLSDQFRKAAALPEKLRSGLTWSKHRLFLRRLLSKYQACTVVSNPEKEIISRIAPRNCRVEVIPNCVDVSAYTRDWGPRDPDQIVFTGSFSYSPNYIGAKWLVDAVLPILKQKNPRAKIAITGDTAGKLFPQPNGVSLLGFVDDVRPHVARAWCSVAPLFEGGGTRLKILEAMALGTPVVATSKGAEGLEAEPGRHLLIADTPQDFAQAIASLMHNPDLHREIGQNGLKLVRERYDWTVVRLHFQSMIGSLQ